MYRNDHLRTLAAALTVCAAFAHAAAADPAGGLIYSRQCASCHGPRGEGTPKAKAALVGDKSVAALADVIAQTMPENNPGSLSAAEAKAVAAYVHEAFYSADAQARNKPPRIELARLTVRQYRNAVADLVGSFRAPPGPWGTDRGLKGEYYNARNHQPNKKAVDRLDPVVKFDFGTASPAAGKIEDAQFAIRWTGSVLPTESGVHEFAVRCDHAVRLWVNDNNKPLVDAWVKSGSDTEFKGSLYLLAGRPYQVRLEMSKAKQGVDDSKKNPPKPTPASISLLWKPPHGTLEVIPARHLSPGKSPEAYLPETPFPPDDRSLGWERGTTVSKAWDQATTDAALDTAGYIVSKLSELAAAPEAAPDRAAKLNVFATKFAERAFRRPLTDEQKQLYVDRQFAATTDPVLAVKRVVLLTLKSPRFLYREVGGPGADAYDTAARLSFALWDSQPDETLMKAAASGQLTTREQVAKQAERMLADTRGRAKLNDFLHVWLKLDHAGDLAKDPKRFPGFDPAVVADLRTSLDLLLDDVVWSDTSDFRKLLLSDELFLNGRLAAFYGVKLPADAGFQRVKLNAGQRAGVLTHPFLMAAFAYTGTSSPIHRGVFLARGVLGLSMRPPPDAFTPLDEGLHPNLTTRDRVALQTKPAACASCHNVINPLGFTLEHFDAVGRFRDKDNGKPVDDDGSYQTRTGKLVKFDGARDLAKYLAGSDEVHAAFAEQLFHHLVQQPVRAYGPSRQDELRKVFADSGFSVRKLAVEVAIAAALTPREAVAVAPRKP